MHRHHLHQTSPTSTAAQYSPILHPRQPHLHKRAPSYLHPRQPTYTKSPTLDPRQPHLHKESPTLGPRVPPTQRKPHSRPKTPPPTQREPHPTPKTAPHTSIQFRLHQETPILHQDSPNYIKMTPCTSNYIENPTFLVHLHQQRPINGKPREYMFIILMPLNSGSLAQ